MTTPVGGVLAAVIMATPFYDALNCHHHWMSDLAAALSLIWRLRILVVAERSMSLLKKDLPALTTLQAWLRRPIRYSRSLFLPCFLSLQEARHALSLASFSWRSLNYQLLCIPRKVICVDGPSVLLGSTGIPRSRQVLCTILRLVAHSCVPPLSHRQKIVDIVA